MKRRPIAAALVSLLASPLAAQEPAPADTLMEMRRAVGACLAKTPVAAGSRVTIAFMLRRDGTVLGKPRIRYAHLEGDAEAQSRFLETAERAVDSCLPVAVSPALGAAIAGRMFTITVGRDRPGA